MTIKSISKSLLAASLVALTLTGCAPNLSPDVYSPYATQQAAPTLKGIVDSARVVKVAGCNTGVGTLGGGALGALAGSQIGAGRGSIVAAIGGGLLGAGLGYCAEKRLGEQWGMEYVICTKNNGYITIVQGTCPTFQRGQHVLVICGPQARVVADPAYR